MGGRGASSGTSKAGSRYGTQYRALLTVGNVKFVTKNARGSETLMETMTHGRIYVHVEGEEIRSIVYFDNSNKRTKQIDIDHPHRPFFSGAHTHHGYLHNERDSAKGAASLTDEEHKMVERVTTIWKNRNRS